MFEWRPTSKFSMNVYRSILPHRPPRAGDLMGTGSMCHRVWDADLMVSNSSARKFYAQRNREYSSVVYAVASLQGLQSLENRLISFFSVVFTPQST